LRQAGGGVTQRFQLLKRCRRVWTISPIHGHVDSLIRAHDAIDSYFETGDRIVYLGNYLGSGDDVAATVDELLSFRRYTMSRPHIFRQDIVYLRGAQEEMWNKVLQLQFAATPVRIIEWMLSKGIAGTLRAYGSSANNALSNARGTVADLTRWTSELRRGMQRYPGHIEFLSHLKRAAYTDSNTMLFVHAGIDPGLPLDQQSDAFWWGHPDFNTIDRRYFGFNRVVTGWDHQHQGVTETETKTVLDAGCGFGGTLLVGCFDAYGTLLSVIEK
jgi:serine/threonine protein phosphatase 1